MKTIFEKAYITEKQCEAAIAKAFGADAINYVAAKGEDRKFRCVEIPAVEPKQHVGLAEALAESGESIEELKDGHSAEAARADAMANATMGGPRAKLQFSTIKSPVKRVWHIADSMPKAARKDVIAECVAQGVASGTARTQYQAWFKASQECERGDIRKPYEKA